MSETNLHEVTSALWGRKPETNVDPRTEVLASMVFDLFMEVAALREVVRSSRLGVGGMQSAYGRAYRAMAYLAHDSTGPSCGGEKLLARFYPYDAFPSRWNVPRPWRERVFLERLGFTQKEISKFIGDAEQAEMLT